MEKADVVVELQELDQEINGEITRHVLRQKGKLTYYNYFSDWKTGKKEAGIYREGKEREDIQIWAQTLSEQVGIYQKNELQTILSEKTANRFSYKHFPLVCEVAEKEHDAKIIDRNNRVILGTYKQRFQKYKEEIDEEYYEVLELMVSKGRSPYSAKAVIDYFVNLENMTACADKYSLTQNSVSQNVEFIQNHRDELSKEVANSLLFD